MPIGKRVSKKVCRKRKVSKTAQSDKPHKVTPATARRIKDELRRR